MKKVLVVAISILMISLSSCGHSWSKEEKREFMSKCQAEALVGYGFAYGVSKLFYFDLKEKIPEDFNTNFIETCACSLEKAQDLYPSYDSFESDWLDRRDSYILSCLSCYEK